MAVAPSGREVLLEEHRENNAVRNSMAGRCFHLHHFWQGLFVSAFALQVSPALPAATDSNTPGSRMLSYVEWCRQVTRQLLPMCRTASHSCQRETDRVPIRLRLQVIKEVVAISKLTIPIFLSMVARSNSTVRLKRAFACDMLC